MSKDPYFKDAEGHALSQSSQTGQAQEETQTLTLPNEHTNATASALM